MDLDGDLDGGLHGGLDGNDPFVRLATEITACSLCPRLIRHCTEIARTKRRAYREDTYWGRPVPGFGDPKATLLVIGLAPGAHGANRTGRMFTGDSSGDWLYRALHQAGYASTPRSVSRDDGLRLTGAYITAVGRCAPPQNRLLAEEIRACRPFLEREIALLSSVRVVVCLGRIAFDTYLRIEEARGARWEAESPAFGHGRVYRRCDGGPTLIASYHPSRQNTQTGRLTKEMLDEVFRAARKAEAW